MLVDFRIENDIALLTINNPSKLNALSSDVVAEVSQALRDVEKRAKVVVIAGTERAFAAGVNVREIAELSFEEAVERNFLDNRWEAVKRLAVPVIAAVSGYALGGGFELALMCDIIIASDSAKFGFPEIDLGLMPGLGGTQMLTQVVGPKIASELIMTGEIIDAERARQLNIVSKIVKPSVVVDEAMAMARTIAAKSTISARFIKCAIDLAQNAGVDAGVKVERNLFRALFATKMKESKVGDFLKK